MPPCLEVELPFFSEKYNLSETSEWIGNYRVYKNNLSWWVYYKQSLWIFSDLALTSLFLAPTLKHTEICICLKISDKTLNYWCHLELKTSLDLSRKNKNKLMLVCKFGKTVLFCIRIKLRPYSNTPTLVQSLKLSMLQKLFNQKICLGWHRSLSCLHTEIWFVPVSQVKAWSDINNLCQIYHFNFQQKCNPAPNTL